MIQRLKTLYIETAIPTLANELSYKNSHEIPKVEKIQINRSLGLAASNNNILKKSIEEFTIQLLVNNQVITKAKKSIAGFKVT